MSFTAPGRQLISLILLSLPTWAGPGLLAQSHSGISTQRIGVQNELVEWAYKSEKAYRDPFNEVDVDVLFTRSDDGHQWMVPAFWAGANQWKVRFAPPAPGVYQYRAESTDKTNPDLNGHEGTLRVELYQGNNSLLLHGPLRVSQSRRYLEHIDGTPFFWLGDTWWKGFSRRISFDEFKVLAADRREKGFTLVQIVAGLYPDEPPFDPRGNNEGGFAWEPEYARINPAYFDYADRRIRWLVKSELAPAIVSCWGYYLPLTGVEKMKKHWRNLVARYGAYPVVWILAGEGVMPYYLSAHPGQDREEQRKGWTEIAKYLRSIDPYHHPITMHPNGSGREELADDGVLDFDMLQTGHGGWSNASRHIGLVTSSYSKTPPIPVVVGEMDYEGHQQTNWQEMQRYAFWSTFMNGATGFTYGAGGIWEMNGTNEPHGPSPQGIVYETVPWNEAMHYPGSTQVGIGKKILSQQQWWRFEPHPDWVEPHGTAFVEPHAEWFDRAKRWADENGEYLLPYASGIPGQIRFVYIPPRIYNPAGPLVKNLEDGIPYHAAYIDPVTGRKYRLGAVVRPQTAELFTDSFDSGRRQEWTDLGEKTTAREMALAAVHSTWTVVKDVRESDVIATVESSSAAETGLLLRVQDKGDCLVAVYSPAMKGIWIHERQNGEYGRRLGFVPVPAIGPKMRMIAEAHGAMASLTLTDGERIYRTLPVKLTQTRAGSVGIWTEALVCEAGAFGACRSAGNRPSKSAMQVFDNFVLEEIRGIPVDANDNIIVMNAWRAPLLPISHDWVLVLER